MVVLDAAVLLEAAWDDMVHEVWTSIVPKAEVGWQEISAVYPVWSSRCSLYLTLRTSKADIPTLRKLPYGIRSRYTGSTVCQRQVPEVGIPTLFSNAYRHRNARVIEIQTRQ